MKKVDWGVVGVVAGTGVVCLGIGALVLWAVFDPAPAGTQKRRGSAVTATQHAVRLLPQSIKEWLAAVFGGVMLLGGLACLAGAAYLILKPEGRQAASGRVARWKPEDRRRVDKK